MVMIGNQPANNFLAVTKDTFNGNASSYTLSKAATTNGVAVYVENVRQIPTTAYSVSGTTLTFTGTTPAGTGNVYVLHHNTPASTATHPAAQALTATSGTFTSDVSIDGGSFVFNESSADKDFRVESDNDANAFFVQGSDGKIGMGISTPRNNLDFGVTSNNDHVIALRDNNTSRTILGLSNGYGVRVGAPSDGTSTEHIFEVGQINSSDGTTYQNTKFAVTYAGNVGIGTVSPLGFTTGIGLHLGDNSSVGFGDGANSRPDFQISCVNGSALDFRCGNGADTADLTINTSGVFSGDFNDTSDERLKENIKDIVDNQIAVLKQLRPVTFDWKEKGKGSDTGFIAQEVKKLLPNDVHYHNPETYESESDLPIYNERDKEDGLIPDGKKVGDKVDDTIKVGDMVNPDSMMAINLQGVVAVLTKALQEAITKIETLQAKVKTLEEA